MTHFYHLCVSLPTRVCSSHVSFASSSRKASCDPAPLLGMAHTATLTGALKSCPSPALPRCPAGSAGGRQAEEGSRAPWSSAPAGRAEPPEAPSIGVTPALGSAEVRERAEGGLSFKLTAQRCGTGVNFEMMSENPNTFPKLAEEQRKLGCISPQLLATNLLCIKHKVSCTVDPASQTKLQSSKPASDEHCGLFCFVGNKRGKKTPLKLLSAFPSTILSSLKNSCRPRGCTLSCCAATSEMWRWLKHGQ